MEQPGPTAITCPRCAGPLVESTCAACGLALTPDQVAELGSLSDLRRWTDDRRAWIVAMAEYAAVHGPVATPAAAPGTAAAAVPAPHGLPTLGAQGCLLSAGAFALVAAGIAFVAVAWGSLSDVGRFLVLLLAGILALGIAWVSAPRIRATATALAIAGVLLVAVDSGFLLIQGDPDVSAPIAALLLGIGVAGMAYGRRARGRMPLAAAVVALTGSLLVAVTAATYPGLAELDLDSTSGWAAVAVALWGLAILWWAGRDEAAPWSWPAGFAILLAAGLAADAVIAAMLEADIAADAWGWAVSLAAFLIAAAVLLLLDRVTGARWPSLLIGSGVAHALALAATLPAADTPPQRPWLALALLIWAASWVGLVAHARQHHPAEARWLLPASPWIGGAVSAAALALLVAPWVDFAEQPSGRAARLAVGDAYPAWRGVLLGLLACGLAAAAIAGVRRRGIGGSGPWSLPQLLPGWPLVALFAWFVVADNDVAWALSSSWDGAQGGVPQVIDRALTAALLVTGLGVIGLAAWVRTIWALWFGALAAVAGVLVSRGPIDLQDWVFAPELLGLALALPLALAGALHVMLAGERQVPTLVTVAPALSALLLPSTASVVADTTERWFSGIFSAAEQIGTAALVRGLTLAVVAAVLVGLGARHRVAGIFWPALVCLVVVVGAQVVDLADRLPPWIVLTVVGVLLVAVGARWEWVRTQGERGRRWAGDLR